MTVKLIRVRFDRIEGADRSKDHMVATLDLAQVPDRAESVTLKGKAYVVHERYWVLPDEEKARMLCVVRLSPLQNPKLGL